jgi:hypothetical protein
MDINYKFTSSCSMFLGIILLVTLFHYTETSLYVSPQERSIVFGQTSLRQYSNNDYHVRVQVPYDYNEGGSGAAWFASFTPSVSSYYPFTMYLDAQNYGGDLSSFISEYIKNLVNSGSFPNLKLGTAIDTSLGGYPASAIAYSYSDPNFSTGITTTDIITKNPINGWIYTLSFVGPSQPMAQYTTSAGISNIAGTFQFCGTIC